MNSPVIFSGVFDLGFDGLVPYTVTVTDVTAQFQPFSTALASDLSFLKLDQPIDFVVTGSVEVDGQISPFTISKAEGSRGAVNGKLSVSADLSQVTLDMRGFEASLLASAATTIFSGSPVASRRLELRLTILFANGLGQETSTPSVLLDTDGDGVPDLIDNCVSVFNDGQEDSGSRRRRRRLQRRERMATGTNGQMI